MVNLQAVGHVSDSASVVLELVCDEAYVVAAFNEALGNLIAVSLYSAELGESKISTN